LDKRLKSRLKGGKVLIETENQRRWWFANHPEFSHKRTGNQGHEDEDEDNEKIRPEAVDKYVDEQLPYARGNQAELLKLIKQIFGTEGHTPEAYAELGLRWDKEASEGLDRKTAKEVETTFRKFPPNVKVNIKPDDPFYQKYVDWYNSLPVKPRGANLKIDFVPANELGNRKGMAVPGTDRVAVFDNASVEWEWKFDSHRVTDKVIDAADWVKKRLWGK
jgi:hypothetical protein